MTTKNVTLLSILCPTFSFVGEKKCTFAVRHHKYPSKMKLNIYVGNVYISAIAEKSVHDIYDRS